MSLSSSKNASYPLKTHIMPTFAWIRGSWHYFFAFGCGSGLARYAPGTIGSLAAIPLFWLSGLWYLSLPFQIVVLSGLFIYGCYASHITGKHLGETDHKGIVIDEIWAMWVLLSFFPKSIMSQALLFGLFRLFDITKPYPIHTVEKRFDNGFGVMIDDGLAALYTAIFFRLLLNALNLTI